MLQDIPQLEDMTEELERLKFLRTTHSNKTAQTQPTLSKPVVVSECKHKKGVSDGKVGSTEMKHHGDSRSSFGGFKKGFLVSSSDSICQVKKSLPPQNTSAPPNSTGQTTTTGSKNIPLIKPKHETKSSLEFPEVQEAMKESFPFLQTQGVTKI